MLHQECSRDKWWLHYSHPDDFTICFWQKSPRVLKIWLAYRAAAVVFFITGYLVIFYFKQDNFPWYKTFIFISFWSYTAQFTSLLLAFVIVLEKLVKQKKKPDLPPLDKMPPHYQILWCLSNIVGPTTVVVFFIFWFVLFNADEPENIFRLLILHIFNVVIILLDFTLNAYPYQFLHFYMSITYGFVYVFFTIGYQLSGGTGTHGEIPIYRILDWREPLRACFTIMIYILCALIIHCAFCALKILKNLLKKPENEPA